jgi:hypothetical protein
MKVKLTSTVNKKAVRYKDHPRGMRWCQLCTMFRPPNSCSYVTGVINPHGYCDAFSRKIDKVSHAEEK